jgi:hypothetical protein
MVRVVSLSLVLVAAVATIGVFTFAKPQYRPPGGHGKTLKFDDAKPPVNGWLWADATPGFHLGEHHDEWKLAMPYVANLPSGAGLIQSLRDKPGGHPEALYVPRNGCIGMQLFSGARTTLCRPHAAAVFIVDALPSYHPGQWNTFVTGVARSDVTKITVQARGAQEDDYSPSTQTHRMRPMPPQVVYDSKTPEWWGAFVDSTYQPQRWNLVVKVYNRFGLMVTARVVPAHAGDAFYCASALPALCGFSAQRSS